MESELIRLESTIAHLAISVVYACYRVRVC